MIPAIDHNKAKEKLQQIISQTEPGSTMNVQSNNLSLNRKQFSDEYNEGAHGEGKEEDEHTKLIKSLPSFKNTNSVPRRGFSQDNKSVGYSNNRDKDGHE